MKVSEVLERLGKREKIKDIAKVLGINESTLQRKMKSLGYVFDTSKKVWFYNDKDNPEPLEVNIMDLVKLNNKNSVEGSHKVMQSNKSMPRSEKKVEEGNVSEVFLGLTDEEITDIREMLLNWRAGSEMTNEYKTLHNEIKTLKRSDRVRKTVVINKGIAERLDKLSERERFDKSDLLELALMKFLKEYE